jgi:hypothetical protein
MSGTSDVGTTIEDFLTEAGSILTQLEPILGAIPGVGEIATITADVASAAPIAAKVIGSVIDALTTARSGAPPTASQWATLFVSRDAAIAAAAPATS